MERGDGEPGLADTDLSGLTRPTPSEVETVRSLKRRRWDFGFVGTSFRYGFLIIPSNTVYTTTMLLLHPLSDADFATSDVDRRRVTSGYVFSVE